MPVPDAAVKALAAGCDAVLVCSGNHDLQFATLEAIVRAVEQEELPYSRIEQALGRQRRAKERYLMAHGTPQPRRTDKALAQVVDAEEHQAVAAEMARFA